MVRKKKRSEKETKKEKKKEKSGFVVRAGRRDSGPEAGAQSGIAQARRNGHDPDQ